MAISVRKLKTGKPHYYVRVRDEIGSNFVSRTFEKKSDAQKYEREIILKRDQGLRVKDDSKKQITVNDYFVLWLEYISMKQSEGWHYSVSRMTHSFILPIIGHMKIGDIKSPHIGKVLSSMNKAGFKPQSILHVYNILNNAFKCSVNYFEYLDKNPVSPQDRPKVHKVESDYLVPADAWKLLEVARNHHHGTGVWLAVLSGLRISEIQALTWDSIDFGKKQILIKAAYKRGVKKIEPFPKQKDWAIVPMPEALHSFLITKSKHKFPKDFVVGSVKGGMLGQKAFWSSVVRLCEEAQIPKVSPHELRHTCTEIWIQMGASIEDIRRLLNHKSAETTQRYIHRTDDRLLSLANSIEEPKLLEA